MNSQNGAHPVKHPGWLIQGGLLLVLAGTLVFSGFQWHDAKLQARKAFAIQMMTEWNVNAMQLRAQLDSAFPDLSQKPDSVGGSTCLCSSTTPEGWEKIYSAVVPDNQPVFSPAKLSDSQVRENLVWMLNYFEAVAVSYQNEVADRRIIYDSLAPILKHWHECFGPFILVATKKRGFNPWYPLSRQVKEWRDRDSESSTCPDTNPLLLADGVHARPQNLPGDPKK